MLPQAMRILLSSHTVRCSPLAPVLAAVIASASADAATLYGVTSSHLVSIDTTTGTTTAIGALGLTRLDSSPVGTLVTPGPLAWNPSDQQLYGLAYDYTFVVSGGEPHPNINVLNQRFIRIDPATGAATSIATLGPRSANPTYDGIEYLGGSVGSLVVSRSSGAGNSSATEIATLSTSGSLATLRTTSLDNDLLAQSASAAVLYSIDPNNATSANRTRTVDLAPVTPSVAFLSGSLPSNTTGELAYDPAGDRLYALDYTVLPSPNKSLYRINTSGGTSLSLEGTITLSGSQVLGIAFSSVPEPTACLLGTGISLGVWSLLRRRTTLRQPRIVSDT